MAQKQNTEEKALSTQAVPPNKSADKDACTLQREAPPLKNIAIACQGGGAQAAYTAGALTVLLKSLAAGDSSEPKRWVGISGTSGGSHTAVIAWYGALEGGYGEAAARLWEYWKENCATLPGEQAHNTLGVFSLDLLPFDFQLNPYFPPLSVINHLNSSVWPNMAALWHPLTSAMRAKYFDRAALLKKYVNFEAVANIGYFLSVPAKIDEWQAAGVRDAAISQCGLLASGTPLSGRSSILKEVTRGLNAGKSLSRFAEKHPGGLLNQAFKQHLPDAETSITEVLHRLECVDDLQWEAPSPNSLDNPLGDIRSLIKPICDALPLLLVGAVDVGRGEFVAFSSRRAPDDCGINPDCLEASSSIPWLFEGKEMKHDDGSEAVYWDGLFSQNPPISDFLSGIEVQSKPHEIWVIQVNPQRCDTENLKYRLPDRRNELSGNLSLNQEIAAVAAINARITMTGSQSGGSDKPVQMLRIPMDSDWLEAELGWPLDFSSKMDRSYTLMETLFRHGQVQAEAFLPVRKLLEYEWNIPSAPATVKVEGLPATGIAGLRSFFKADHLRFEVADMVVEFQHPARRRDKQGCPIEPPRARISWFCHLPVPNPENGQPNRQRLEGIANIELKEEIRGANAEDRIYTIARARMTSIALTWPDMLCKPVGWRTLPSAISTSKSRQAPKLSPQLPRFMATPNSRSSYVDTAHSDVPSFASPLSQIFSMLSSFSKVATDELTDAITKHESRN